MNIDNINNNVCIELNENELMHVNGGKSDEGPKQKTGPGGVQQYPIINVPYSNYTCEDFANTYGSCNECPYREQNLCTVNHTVLSK